MTLKTKTAIFILFFSFLGLAIPGNAQVNGYRLECNGQSVTFSAVSGLDAPVRTTLSGLRTVQTSGVKTITLNNVRISPSNELYSWFSSFGRETVQKRDVVVRLFNQTGALVKSWKIRQAGPLKVEGPTLSAKGNEVTMESVVLSHEGIEPE